MRGTTRLEELIEGLSVTVIGHPHRWIRQVTTDSRQVGPGALFVAIRGGKKFIPEAIRRGAVAIALDTEEVGCPSVAQLVSPQIDTLLPTLLDRFYRPPRLALVGITGTNGKTTTSYLIHHILNTCGHKSGLIGTIGCKIGEEKLSSTHTTPDLSTLIPLFQTMGQKGCTAAVMEVSSHALDQGRVQGVSFQVALFTNLTLDHLDYHGTMEAYAAAKAHLFTTLQPTSTAVINADDPWSEQIVMECPAPLFTYGIDHEADLRASHLALSPYGMEMQLHFRGLTWVVQSPLIGKFNVYNLLAAVSAALVLGISIEKSLRALSTFHAVPGRLERVVNPKNIPVFVDYAHTDDALDNVLRTLRELGPKRIITIFGCGGDRDVSKRPKMARVAEALSDVVIVTTDNPRSESPEAIIAEIVRGFARKEFLVEIDRAEAISKAMGMAREGDLVLIAGKGHETVQIFADRTVPFDDRDLIRNPLF
jgi:UDP-N-acetylmuramoyl-L-alanyl-D-glutamate--2,6-diaminopimelate ligase